MQFRDLVLGETHTGGLDGCIGCGCLSLRTCSLQNPDDVLGETHTGAPLLEVDDKAS